MWKRASDLIKDLKFRHDLLLQLHCDVQRNNLRNTKPSFEQTHLHTKNTCLKAYPSRQKHSFFKPTCAHLPNSQLPWRKYFPSNLYWQTLGTHSKEEHCNKIYCDWSKWASAAKVSRINIFDPVCFKVECGCLRSYRGISMGLYTVYTVSQEIKKIHYL